MAGVIASSKMHAERLIAAVRTFAPMVSWPLSRFAEIAADSGSSIRTYRSIISARRCCQFFRCE